MAIFIEPKLEISCIGLWARWYTKKEMIRETIRMVIHIHISETLGKTPVRSW
jgi:hypothetical protein